MPKHEKNKKTFVSTKLSLILIFLIGVVIGGGALLLFNSKTNYNTHDIFANDSLFFDDNQSRKNGNVAEVNGTQSDTARIVSSLDSNTYQQIWLSLISEPGYREMDSLFLDSIIKKIYADSVSNVNTIVSISDDDEFVVENEAMVSAKNYMVKAYYTQTLADTINEKAASVQKIYVEYWSSPIHFAGYSKIGKSIRLYSVLPSEILGFIFLNDTLYFNKKSQWYCLSDHHKEKSYEKENSRQTIEILNKLNK